MQSREVGSIDVHICHYDDNGEESDFSTVININQCEKERQRDRETERRKRAAYLDDD